MLKEAGRRKNTMLWFSSTFDVYIRCTWGCLGTSIFENLSSVANNTRSRPPSRLSFRFLRLWPDQHTKNLPSHLFVAINLVCAELMTNFSILPTSPLCTHMYTFTVPPAFCVCNLIDLVTPLQFWLYSFAIVSHIVLPQKFRNLWITLSSR